MKSMYKKIINFFTPIEWKVIFRGTCKARHTIFGINQGVVECYVFLKVSTNKRNIKYQCYYTDDGIRKKPLGIDILMLNYPNIKPILDEYKIHY